MSLSEQQFADYDTKDSGLNVDNAFETANKNGIRTEASYTCRATGGTSCTVGLFNDDVVGFNNVARDSVQDLMSTVGQQPVSITIVAVGTGSTSSCTVGLPHSGAVRLKEKPQTASRSGCRLSDSKPRVNFTCLACSPRYVVRTSTTVSLLLDMAPMRASDYWKVKNSWKSSGEGVCMRLFRGKRHRSQVSAASRLQLPI